MLNESLRDSKQLMEEYTMTSAAQRAELQSKIWKIANDVRGSVD